MSSVKSIHKSTEWDAAIEDAKKRISRLQSAIETFKEKKKTGEPWPGQMADTNNTQVVPR